jgi:hypothetical protein
MPCRPRDTQPNRVGHAPNADRDRPRAHPRRLPRGREAPGVTQGRNRAPRGRARAGANATNGAAHVRAHGLRGLRGSIGPMLASPRGVDALPRHRRRRGIGRLTPGPRRDRNGRSGIAGRRGIRRWLRGGAGIRGRQRWPGLRSRQVVQRIDVALRIGREPDTEMDIRLRELGIATRADGPDDLSFRDRVSAPHRVGAEVHERDGVAVGTQDRDSLPSARYRARECDRARHRCLDGRAAGSADVHAAMRAGRIGMGAIEREGRQHRPVDRPAPTQRGSRREERRREDCRDHEAHLCGSSLSNMATTPP